MPEIRNEQQRGLTIFNQLDTKRGDFLDLLPPFMKSPAIRDRMFAIAFQALRDPQIARCTPISIVNSVLKSARWGLDCDGIHAALVAYGSECTFMPMYPGRIKVVRRSDEVDQFSAEPVFKGEPFEVYYGTDRRIVHRPIFDGSVKRTWENLVCTYSTARFTKTGLFDFAISDIEEIEHCRDRSRAKNGPWKTDPIAMARKTPVNKHCKTLPVPDEIRLLMQEAEDDEFGRSEQPREVELEQDTKAPPKSLGELAQRRTQVVVPAAVPKEDPEAQQASASEDDFGQPLPPERWFGEFRIVLADPPEQWLDIQIGAQGPLNGLTYRQAAASSDPVIAKEVKRLIAEAVQIQADGSKSLSPAYSRLAEACRLHLSAGPFGETA